MIMDSLGRSFSKLRISLTQRCNYSCSYCVPDGSKHKPAPNEMTADEFYEATRLLTETAGIQKLRLTGGEPLLFKDLEYLLKRLNTLGLKDISLTTNGKLLAEKAEMLADNGIQKLNVSIDTARPEKFRELTKSGSLERAMAGINKALDVGIKLKVNMVPMRTHNHEDIISILDMCLNKGIECRYIELMKMGHIAEVFEKEFVPMEEILTMIGQKYDYVKMISPSDSTSVCYQIPEKGRFGIIANESEPFCSGCSRLRLTSDGFLYGCLSSTQKFLIRDLLEIPDELAEKKLTHVLQDALATKQTFNFSGSKVLMKSVGG